VDLSARIYTLRSIHSNITFAPPPPETIVIEEDEDDLKLRAEDADGDEPKGSPPPINLELVYNIRQSGFHHVPRTEIFPDEAEEEKDAVDLFMARNKPIEEPRVFFEAKEDDPPLLCDGRVQLLRIPRWKRNVKLWWRISSGMVLSRRVELPSRIW
jgi:hypothetical protein